MNSWRKPVMVLQLRPCVEPKAGLQPEQQAHPSASELLVALKTRSPVVRFQYH